MKNIKQDILTKLNVNPLFRRYVRSAINVHIPSRVDVIWSGYKN